MTFCLHPLDGSEQGQLPRFVSVCSICPGRASLASNSQAATTMDGHLGSGEAVVYIQGHFGLVDKPFTLTNKTILSWSSCAHKSSQVLFPGNNNAPISPSQQQGSKQRKRSLFALHPLASSSRAGTDLGICLRLLLRPQHPSACSSCPSTPLGRISSLNFKK